MKTSCCGFSSSPDSPLEIEAFCREGAGRYGWRAVGVTLGRSRLRHLLPTGSLSKPAGHPVEVVDTVGAGDAFAAAFMHGLSSTGPSAEIAAFANRLPLWWRAATARSRIGLSEETVMRAMRNEVQLIAYVDRLSGGGFRDAPRSARWTFPGLCSAACICCPFYWPIDGADAGFDPIDHTQPDSRLGSWEDVRALAEGRDLMADLIVNHISIRSPQFEDFRQSGDLRPTRDLFLTGRPRFPPRGSEDDLLQIYRPRPGLPFTKMRLDDGAERLLWTTFTLGADRYRRPLAGGTRVSGADPARVSSRWNSGDPPGCSGLRDQEAWAPVAS